MPDGEASSPSNSWVAPAAILATGAVVVALLMRGQQTLEEPPPDPRPAEPTSTDKATPVAEPSQDPGSLLQRSRELEAAGRLGEAAQAAREALARGAERDGALQAAKIEILRENYGSARELLVPLTRAAQPDPDAEYNLGLVAHRQRKYNEARTHYLAALEAEPRYAAARFNLAVLARDFGFADEAGHHAQQFATAFPDDPRVRDLAPLLNTKPSIPVAEP